MTKKLFAGRTLGEALLDRVRRKISRQYLSGSGIEIGALHWPLPVPRGATVRYVDRMDVESLRSHYPELAGRCLVPVDIIDNGESLDSIPDASQDFVIANHFLEHTQDPVGTIEQHLRVLRPGGYLYLAVPMKDVTFDVLREATSIEHVIADHEVGPEGSRLGHYQEWAQFVEHIESDLLATKVADLIARDYSIHFHVWDEPAFRKFVEHLETLFPMAAVHLRRNRHELIVIVRKLSVNEAGGPW